MKNETNEDIYDDEDFKAFLKKESEPFDWSTLPKDVSLDFAMNEENLYVVWYETTRDMYLINKNEGPVQISYILASEDIKEARKEIFGGYSEWTKVFSIIKFKELNNIISQFNDKKSVFNIFPKNIYYVNKNNDEYWTDKKEGKVLLKGSISDIGKVFKDVKNILDTKNYIKVHDVRPDQFGHPEDWLFFMQHPHSALGLREDK